MSRQFLLPLLLSLSGLVACAAPATDPAEVRVEIDTAWSSFETAWLAGDVSAATAAFFSVDAINTVPNSPESRGRAAIETSFAAFRATTKVVATAHATEEVEVAGDLAYEGGTFVQTTQQGTAAPQAAHARYLAIWKRQADGKWKCHRFLFNDAPAQPS